MVFNVGLIYIQITERHSRIPLLVRATAAFLKNLEAEMIRWNEELADRLACPIDEKRLLFPLVESICEMAARARQEGLLGLDVKSSGISDAIFRIGTGMIVDGCTEETLEDVFASYLHTFDERGYLFLKACLIAEGLLSIQEGDNPRITRRKLASYLGEEALAELVAEDE
jgi:flagellar motor component MotA